ncbi:serpentine type 7TM GPCR chemoreceptor srsx domain-containing protein [Ditylenchus destructor]|nr:serpentine type 7TM GPCR chemoreceptor srsx domain-containing protein [Ditylenchus destructor]
MSEDGARDESLYSIFNGKGASPILVSIFVIKWLVGMVGEVANANLVYVTIRHKSLHSPCHYLLAVNSFLYFVHQTYHFIPLVLSLTGINFIKLPLCFYMEPHAVFSLQANWGISLFIGIDRLLSVTIWIWQKHLNVTMYLSVIVSICSIYGFYIVYLSAQVVNELPDMMILCQHNDIYQKEVGTIVTRNALIIIALNILCYVIVWICLIRSALKRNALRESFSQASARIYKSLTVIMAVEVFGYLSNTLFRLTIIPKLRLSALNTLYVNTASSLLTNVAMASNAFILYAFSREYHRVFQMQIFYFTSRFCKKSTIVASSLQRSTNQLRGSTILANSVIPTRKVSRNSARDIPMQQLHVNE